jgi:hypothetical protein
VLTVQTNQAYNNRIVLNLTNSGFIGPFVQEGNGPLGLFSPTRDLEVYIDGTLTPILNSAFDGNNSRYLLYMAQAIDLQGVIQVVHRMPSPPFEDAADTELPGFALIATYTPSVVPYGWGVNWGAQWGAGTNY